MTDAQYRALLAARREQLVQRAQAQRVLLAHAALPLVQALHWLERGAGVWRALRARSWWVLAPAVALTLWRPRSALRAVPALLALWRVVARHSLR